MHPFQIEERRGAAVLWFKGATHRHYEDRYRLLSRDVPLVAASDVGEVFAVADGVGSAPLGMSAAQHLCDRLAQIYAPGGNQDLSQRLRDLLVTVNREIHGWGFIEGTDRPAGACAATVVLLEPNGTRGFIAHAGDTRAALIRDGQCQILTPLDQSVDGALRCYLGAGAPSLTLLPLSVELGDRLLLVSDGVTKSYGMAEVAAMLESQPTRRRALQVLGQACHRRPSGDDVTAMVIDVGDD
ncbi:MAG: protein phosphatase 2C domain-containing protein [Novosphingobium sp.]|nr:protein phosphatase 2C domain-containing protein [Novosphingobium sp.]